MGERIRWSDGKRERARVAREIAKGVEKRVAEMPKVQGPPPRPPMPNIPEDWDFVTGRS